MWSKSDDDDDDGGEVFGWNIDADEVIAALEEALDLRDGPGAADGPDFEIVGEDLDNVSSEDEGGSIDDLDVDGDVDADCGGIDDSLGAVGLEIPRAPATAVFYRNATDR